MTEMVIPGTYIEVRAEGLISAGQVSTGIVGVVGTASRGPIGVPVTLSGFSDARDQFGLPDPYTLPTDGAHPLTLLRALEQIYNNGASGVIAVRVAGSSRASATYAVTDKDGNTVATLAATSPGAWGNDIHLAVDPAEDEARIDGETHTTTFSNLNHAPVHVSPENRIRILHGNRRIQPLNIVYKRVTEQDVPRDSSGKAPRFVLSQPPLTEPTQTRVQVLNPDGTVAADYGVGPSTISFATSTAAGATPPGPAELRVLTDTRELVFGTVPAAGLRVHARYAVGDAAPASGQVLVTTWSGELTFADAAPTAPDDQLDASYLVDRTSCVEVTLTHATTTETYVVPGGVLLAERINASPTSLVTAEPASDALPRPGIDDYFGRGSNDAGADGAEATPDDYKDGLDALAGELVNIVVPAGQDANTTGSQLLGHLNATEAVDLERIGVIGAHGTTVPEFLGQPLADGRVVVVAPGLRLADGTTLPSAYAAAAVAGLISSLPVNASLTNKVLTIPGLALPVNRGQQEQLIRRSVLTVVAKAGYRVVKGITTSGEGTPFASIPTRRIVDYAKYGVRSAANPYIGRLNNDRVRAALKATLDGFLTRMVQDESLTGYVLDVSATRAQEIAGEVSVVMVLQPTFSIEYVRVVMNLK
jgi:hypothetical protein